MTYLKRIPLAVAVLAALSMAALGLSACGSSAKSAPAPAASNVADTVSAACQQVSAVLSDGPDPDADPVGYDEAQVIPLSQVRTQDATLRDAIAKLAGAYQEFFTDNGSKTAKEAVSVASSAINKICPGAAS
jgi:hypothetical protein